MSRGGHVNPDATEARNFLDPQSHVALYTGKVFLFGEDMSAARKRVYLRDERRCVDCTKMLAYDEFMGMELSHEIPKSLGGDDSDDNLKTRCNRCHDRHDGHGQPRHF